MGVEDQPGAVAQRLIQPPGGDRLSVGALYSYRGRLVQVDPVADQAVVKGAHQDEAARQRMFGGRRDVAIRIGEGGGRRRAQPGQGGPVFQHVGFHVGDARRAAVEVAVGVAAELVSGRDQPFQVAGASEAAHGSGQAGHPHGDEIGSQCAPGFQQWRADLDRAQWRVVERERHHRPIQPHPRGAAVDQTRIAAAQLGFQRPVGGIGVIEAHCMASRQAATR